MRTWSIPAGRIAGIDIRIHFTFFLLLLFVIVPDLANPITPGRALGLVAIVFGSVVLHELGHALVARHAGLPVRAITLLPIGGVTTMETSQSGPPAPDTEIRIAAAGPLVNFVIAGIAALVIVLALPGASVWLWQTPFVHAMNL